MYVSNPGLFSLVVVGAERTEEGDAGVFPAPRRHQQPVRVKLKRCDQSNALRKEAFVRFDGIDLCEHARFVFKSEYIDRDGTREVMVLK